jgi:hypothetical protein
VASARQDLRRFGPNYSPATALCESCSSCGLVFFNTASLAYRNAKYADLYEQTCTTSAGGVALLKSCHQWLVNTQRTLGMCAMLCRQHPANAADDADVGYEGQDRSLREPVRRKSYSRRKVAGTNVDGQKTDYPWKGAGSQSIREAKPFGIYTTFERNTSKLYAGRRSAV